MASDAPATPYPAIGPSLNLLLIDTILTAMLVPLLIVLFWLSILDLRRKPIFVLNVIAVLICMSCGALAIYLQVRPSFIIPSISHH